LARSIPPPGSYCWPSNTSRVHCANVRMRHVVPLLLLVIAQRREHVRPGFHAQQLSRTVSGASIWFYYWTAHGEPLRRHAQFRSG
jgi:hypothetical protein